MAERREPLDEERLKALIATELSAARNYDKEELSSTRARAIEYYRGTMTDTPAAANRSEIVSRDVADTIGLMLPGLVRTFTASDRMADYEPVEPSDEQFAKQATDYINHIFWKDNDGYRILWDSSHDSLLLGNGIVKHWWDDTPVCEYHNYSGLTAEQIALLKEEQGVEIIAQEKGEPQSFEDIGPDGQMVPVTVETFNIRVKRERMNGKVRLASIEPENFLVDGNLRFLDEFRLVAHRDAKTRSELIEMGFPRDKIDTLSSHRGQDWSEESISRDRGWSGLTDVGDESTRLIELFECYLKVDVDGDGVSETVQAFYAGNAGAGELLSWEVWEDDIPFTDIPCEPQPHRWDARSVFDETQDIQRVKTVVLRAFADNIYWQANPLREAEYGSVINPEVMLNPTFGATIWRKKGSQPIVPHLVPYIGDKMMAGLEYLDAVAEKRTGVSRSTMALDPETLQNQTATANQNQRDAAYSQIELIARNQAELGWRRVFRALLKIVVKHQDRPRTVRLRDEWVEMDPRAWNANMDVTINVGLGTGSRDRDMAMLNVMSQGQAMLAERLATAGFAEEAIDMLPRITKTMIQIAESAGVRNPDAYYPTFDEQKIAEMKAKAAQPQSNPKIEEIQAKGEVDKQLKGVDAEVAMHEARLKAEGEVAKNAAELQADLQTKEADRQNAIIIAREQGQIDLVKQERELAFKQWDAEQNRALERERMAHEREQAAQQRQMDAYKTNVAAESKREASAAKAHNSASPS